MRILVTAGPTREFFDTVRFISNPSSGKMGCLIAEEAANLGHEVRLVLGPVGIEPPGGVETTRVVSSREMYEASAAAFESCDAAIFTAAVCDYRPARTLDHKLQKRSQDRHITLVPTQDIAAALGKIKQDRITIGFAMEDHDHHAHAEQKLKRKNCDAIVLNGPENVGSDDATVEILGADGEWSGPFSGSKRAIAAQIVRLVESLRRTAS